MKKILYPILFLGSIQLAYAQECKLKGVVADETTIHSSYIIGVLCFAYLAFYAWKVSGILKNQGINFDKKVAGNH